MLLRVSLVRSEGVGGSGAWCMVYGVWCGAGNTRYGVGGCTGLAQEWLGGSGAEQMYSCKECGDLQVILTAGGATVVV